MRLAPPPRARARPRCCVGTTSATYVSLAVAQAATANPTSGTARKRCVECVLSPRTTPATTEATAIPVILDDTQLDRLVLFSEKTTTRGDPLVYKALWNTAYYSFLAVPLGLLVALLGWPA